MTSTSSSEDLSLLDYWAILRKRWPWVLIPMLLSIGLAVAFDFYTPDRYQATAKVLLNNTASQGLLGPSSQNVGFLSRELSNEISLAESDAVLQLIEQELDYLPEVEIRADSNADVLEFRSEALSAEEAATEANTWANSYISVKRNATLDEIETATTSVKARLAELRAERQELRKPLDSLDDRIGSTSNEATAAKLQRQYDRLADDLRYELELLGSQAAAAVESLTQLELQAEISKGGGARISQVAAPPTKTSNTPFSRTLTFGVIAGLMVGFCLALLAEMRDNTIKTSADVLAVTDVPVLASIPAADKRQQLKLALVAHHDPEGIHADAYHKVRSALEFSSLGKDVKTILITSPNPSEGKSTSSSNLSLTLASVGKRTVLLDIDYRRAKVHKIYNVDQQPGFSDSVSHGIDMRLAARSFKEPGLENLLVIPTGTAPPNPAAFVATAHYKERLDHLRNEAEVVVLDAPPLLSVSDSHTLSKYVDAVILTARAGGTSKSELSEAVATLTQIGANVLGIVLIGVSEADSYKGHYYYQKDDGVGQRSAKSSASAESLWNQQGPPQEIINLSHSNPERPTQVKI